jgi:ankyrin repeat protein
MNAIKFGFLLVCISFYLYPMELPEESKGTKRKETEKPEETIEIKKKELEEAAKKSRMETEKRSELLKKGEYKNIFAFLPADIQKLITEYLVAAPGSTQTARLFAAGQNIHSFLVSNNLFAKLLLNDQKMTAYFIDELAQRYAGGNKALAAVALATSGAGAWLTSYIAQKNGLAEAGQVLKDAAGNGDIGIVNFILKYAPSTANLIYGDASALLKAAEKGHTAVVEKLLAAPGVNVNIKTRNAGATALYIAAQNGHTAVVEKLLAAPGVNVNLQTLKGATALYVAAQMGHTAIVEKLLAAPGINVNLQAEAGVTPLLAAVWNGHTAIVEKLLAAPGINVNPQAQGNATPLMTAVTKDNAAIVEKLIKAGASINMKDTTGKTALSRAQQSTSPNKETIIKLLKANGAV